MGIVTRKGIVKGVSTFLLGTLMTYFTATGTAKAQNAPSEIMDSTVVEKTIPFNLNTRDEVTNEPIEGVGAELYGKYAEDDTYESFIVNGFYDFEEPFITKEDGNFSASFTIDVFDKITSVKDYKNLVPSEFNLGRFPNPYNPESRAVFSVKEKGTYTYEFFDEDGSSFGKKSAVLSPGNYEVLVNSGAAGRDFFRVTGPDGHSEVMSSVNLGGGSSPFMKDVTGSNYSVNKSPLEKVLEKQGVHSATNFDRAMDTLAIGWGKDGYWAESLDKIPLYGIFSNDTVKTTTPDGSTYDKIYVSGDKGSDTLKVLWNDKLSHTVILYGAKDGSPIDSVDFNIGLEKK